MTSGILLGDVLGSMKFEEWVKDDTLEKLGLAGCYVDPLHVMLLDRYVKHNRSIDCNQEKFDYWRGRPIEIHTTDVEAFSTRLFYHIFPSCSDMYATSVLYRKLSLQPGEQTSD